jgi:hypothetical protein
LHTALKILFAASGVLPLVLAVIQRETTLLIYSLFVALYFVSSRRISKFNVGKIIIATLLAGFAAEILSWASNYIASSRDPHPLSPQLLSDLFIAIGYYAGWAIAWMIMAARYRFGLAQVFVTTGIMGIIVEQQGNVFREIISNALVNPAGSYLLAFFVFVVYGSIMGISRLFWTSTSEALRGSLTKYIAVVILMFVLSLALTEAFSVLGGRIGIVQAPLPIRASSFFPDFSRATTPIME